MVLRRNNSDTVVYIACLVEDTIQSRFKISTPNNPLTQDGTFLFEDLDRLLCVLELVVVSHLLEGVFREDSPFERVYVFLNVVEKIHIVHVLGSDIVVFVPIGEHTTQGLDIKGCIVLKKSFSRCDDQRCALDGFFDEIEGDVVVFARKRPVLHLRKEVFEYAKTRRYPLLVPHTLKDV